MMPDQEKFMRGEMMALSGIIKLLLKAVCELSDDPNQTRNNLIIKILSLTNDDMVSPGEREGFDDAKIVFADFLRSF